MADYVPDPHSRVTEILLADGRVVPVTVWTNHAFKYRVQQRLTKEGNPQWFRCEGGYTFLGEQLPAVLYAFAQSEKAPVTGSLPRGTKPDRTPVSYRGLGGAKPPDSGDETSFTDGLLDLLSRSLAYSNYGAGGGALRAAYACDAGSAVRAVEVTAYLGSAITVHAVPTWWTNFCAEGRVDPDFRREGTETVSVPTLTDVLPAIESKLDSWLPPTLNLNGFTLTRQAITGLDREVIQSAMERLEPARALVKLLNESYVVGESRFSDSSLSIRIGAGQHTFIFDPVAGSLLETGCPNEDAFEVAHTIATFTDTLPIFESTVSQHARTLGD